MTFKEFCQATFIIVFLVGAGVWGGYSYRAVSYTHLTLPTKA